MKQALREAGHRVPLTRTLHELRGRTKQQTQRVLPNTFRSSATSFDSGKHRSTGAQTARPASLCATAGPNQVKIVDHCGIGRQRVGTGFDQERFLRNPVAGWIADQNAGNFVQDRDTGLAPFASVATPADSPRATARHRLRHLPLAMNSNGPHCRAQLVGRVGFIQKRDPGHSLEQILHVFPSPTTGDHDRQ